VLSLKVGDSGASKMRPARMHSYKTGEFCGQQPITRHSAPRAEGSCRRR